MKKILYTLTVLFGLGLIISCSEADNLAGDGDVSPKVTIYSYKVPAGKDPDATVNVRFVPNSLCEKFYVLIEKKTERDIFVNNYGRPAYAKKVVENGNQYAAQILEMVNDTLAGVFSITAVGMNKNGETGEAFDFTFVGLEWRNVATGTYHFFNTSRIGISSNPTVLQVCTTDDKLYRFKNVFANNYHLKINLLDITSSDSYGTYRFFRVPVTATPFTYNSGAVSVRDIGYWYNDAYVLEYGYESKMYSDYRCHVLIQYFASKDNDDSTINMGWDNDIFIPD
jgi:hypothetical protein